MKRGVSPIVSVVFILIVVFAALAVFRVWYLDESQHGQLAIAGLTQEKGTQALEDIVVENCNGTSIWVRNKGVNDIYFRRNNVFVINIYRNNAELNLSQLVLSPNIDVLHPGQIVQIGLTSASPLISLGQTIKLTTENRRSLFFSYNIGSVVASANPTDIWANDGDAGTTADLSTVTAYVTDSFGNPVSTINGYPTVAFYVDNGTISAAGTITNGKGTASYRSTSYTNAEIKFVEGVWYHYDHAMVNASVSETSDGTAGGTVIRTISGTVSIDFKAIINAYGNYPTASGASIDNNNGGLGNVTDAAFKLKYRDGSVSPSSPSCTSLTCNNCAWQCSEDTTSDRSSGTNFPGTLTDGQWTQIYFQNTLPSNITDTNYLLTSVKVNLYHYEQGISSTTYFLTYRDDLWVNNNGNAGTWIHIQNYGLVSGPTFGPFESQNLVSIINTVTKANTIYIRLFYNPCFMSGSDCVANKYFMVIDYAAVIIEYTRKNV